ncbi:unnamed protein product [Closterium sp. Yama58-4]|nr:unnamed protein product [Closterium sp. Yama58-4]
MQRAKSIYSLVTTTNDTICGLHGEGDSLPASPPPLLLLLLESRATALPPPTAIKATEPSLSRDAARPSRRDMASASMAAIAAGSISASSLSSQCVSSDSSCAHQSRATSPLSAKCALSPRRALIPCKRLQSPRQRQNQAATFARRLFTPVAASAAAAAAFLDRNGASATRDEISASASFVCNESVFESTQKQSFVPLQTRSSDTVDAAPPQVLQIHQNSLPDSRAPLPRLPSALPALLLVAAAALFPLFLSLVSPFPALAADPSATGAAAGAATSIAKSGLGLRVAAALRESHWPDAAIVTFIASLPVVELRGAIPVAYWMGMEPVVASSLAVLGNMVPVPFLLTLLGPAITTLANLNPQLKSLLNSFLDHSRAKAAPIAEFQWLGLALFVAVPLPGTGAWSGAIGAYILGMPFWEALTANLAGVVLAGVLVNLLVTLPLQQALGLAVLLLGFSSVCWSLLRWIRKKLAL